MFIKAPEPIPLSELIANLGLMVIIFTVPIFLIFFVTNRFIKKRLNTWLLLICAVLVSLVVLLTLIMYSEYKMRNVVY